MAASASPSSLPDLPRVPRRPLVGQLCGLALCLLTVAAPRAEETGSEAVFDRVWSHARLWENPDSGAYVALSGRLQFDSYWFSADEDDVPPGAENTASDMLWRRFRFGFKSEFAGGFIIQLEGDFNLNNDLDDIYNRLTDAYIGYSPGEAWTIKFLKQSAGYTLDGATSSKKLLTLQRNNLTSNLWATDEYFSGLHVGGSISGRWSYRAGIFSGDDSNEIGFDDVGYFTLLSLGYDFARGLNMDDALVRLDYVYNSKDDDDQLDDDDAYDNNGTPDYRHTTSLVTQWEKGSWGLSSDLSFGQGIDQQSDVWGVVLMPYFSFNRHHQVVLRYTYLDSAEDNGLRFGRYEREIVGSSARGNRYNELYAGYNLFFYGHKLKWQTGLQYTRMADAADDGGEYAGWGLTTGMRMSW